MEGIIVKGIGGFYYIKSGDTIYECKARGKFRHSELTPMVGDRVIIELQGSTGVIVEILPRTSELLRPMVANVTQAFVVISMKNPDYNPDLLNKFLLQCEYYGLKIIICLNKTDLAREEELTDFYRVFENVGYPILKLQAKAALGIEEVKKRLCDEVSVFCGPSGVGKSTILNGLLGKVFMETGSISEKIGRGKHTTRHSQLVHLAGGLVVDTPGFSSIDLSFLPEEELQQCMPEFRDFIGECKFRGCIHYKEPSCAVKAAVQKGIISVERYDFYCKVIQEKKEGRNRK